MKKLFVYLFFFANFLIIIWFWWSNSGPQLFLGTPSFLISLGRLSGLLAAYFILLQFMLIGRAIWIERAFGLDKLSQIHRLNGHLAIIFILIHPILLTVGYSIATNTNLISQFLTFLKSYEDVFNAFAALLLFLFIVGFSIYIVRKKLKYEVWYFVHLLVYLAAFLSWGHQLKNGEDFLANKTFVYYWYFLYVFIFANHLLFRFFRPLYLFWEHKFIVDRVVKENHNVVSVYISGKHLKRFKMLPGQFMILRFLDKKHWWQAHPFSLSQVADGKTLRVTIKNVGDFTSSIGHIKPKTRVVIDGPFGTFTEREAKNKKVLLIAAGIGITPIRSLLESLIRHKRDVVLLYANRKREDIVFFKEIEKLKKKYKFTARYILSQEKRSGFILGHVDKNVIKKLVPDVASRDVYVCGPFRMTDALTRNLKELGMIRSQIHFEKFSL